jgi:hypothetical protein
LTQHTNCAAFLRKQRGTNLGDACTMTWLRAWLALLGGALVASGTGCASWVADPVETPVSQSSVDKVNGELPPWSGSWDGTWETSDGSLHPARASLVQRGLYVEGVVELDDQPCVPRVSILAEVNGRGLDTRAHVGDAEVRSQVTFFDGKEQEGTVSLVDPAACAAKEGGHAVLRLRR